MLITLNPPTPSCHELNGTGLTSRWTILELWPLLKVYSFDECDKVKNPISPVFLHPESWFLYHFKILGWIWKVQHIFVAGPISALTSQIGLRVFMRVRVCSVSQRWDNRYNKSDVFIAGITNVYVNVHSSCMWSSARMGYVVSWYGRVVFVRNRMFDEGSWHWSSRGDTARCLM